MSRDPFADPEPLIRRVYAYVAYRLGDGPDAEDVTSSAIERALKYRASFDPRRGRPEAWLIGIARTCIDEYFRGRVLNEEVRDTAGHGELERETVLKLSVSAAMAELDKADRELIALRYGADLSTRQIAGILQMRSNAVDVALHRARERLRMHLEGVGVDAPRPSPKAVAGPAPEPSA